MSAFRRHGENTDLLTIISRQAQDKLLKWAVAEGLLELPDIDPYDVLAGDMASALREDSATDPQGRRTGSTTRSG